MSEQYKMVPVEPTREMERAAESYWNERRFKGLSDDPRTWAGVYQSMLAAAPDVTILVEALERISNMNSMSYHSIESAKIVAKAALDAYRDQKGDL